MEKAKKLINSVKDCVDESLEGVVAVNPGLRKLRGHRVIVRSDLEDYVASGKVAILTGGGSGHEPAFSGYVGYGMATGAVQGAFFASPGSKAVLAAIRALAKNNTAGILVIFNNYTGDRINFGIAEERAKAEGIKIAMVTNGEDCALVTSDKAAGRRGLAGLILILKVAGNLAEEGRNLEEITEQTKRLAASIGTLGICLSPCSVPGVGQLFQVGTDEMELGLGLHGEAGVKTVKMMTAHDTVTSMIDHMTNTGNKAHFRLTKGEDVALLINNLGSTSDLEMNIVAREAILYLESKGIKLSRVYMGRYVTSQDMAGVSVTLMQLDRDVKRSLDAECRAFAWTSPVLHRGDHERKPEGDVDTDDVDIKSFGQCAQVDYGSTIVEVIKAICEVFITAEDKLNQLDTRCGDGDCGTTMRAGAERLMEALRGKEQLNVDKPYELLLQTAALIEESMGGSSGGLYSVFLTAAATALKEAVTSDTCRQALKAGIDAIQRYGGAEPGDRSMLDPLYAAYKVWEEKHASSEHIRDIISDVAKAAMASAKMTASMPAHVGRASYVSIGNCSQPDAGAMAVAMWLEAVSKILQ